jgi:hypothetical protein
MLATPPHVFDPPEAADDLLFNAGSLKVKLRNDLCRRNVFHALLKPIKTVKVDCYPLGVAFYPKNMHPNERFVPIGENLR